MKVSLLSIQIIQLHAYQTAFLKIDYYETNLWQRFLGLKSRARVLKCLQQIDEDWRFSKTQRASKMPLIKFVMYHFCQPGPGQCVVHANFDERQFWSSSSYKDALYISGIFQFLSICCMLVKALALLSIPENSWQR